MEQRVSIAEARADLSAYINRVAHGGQRLILTSRGRPKAALVSIDDLERLLGAAEAGSPDDEAEDDLAEVDEFVESLKRRLEGEFLPDSAELLHTIRKERMEQLGG